MPVIDINAIKPGMVLRTDVTDNSGRLLLLAHTAITEKHLQVMRTWGVYHIDIATGDDAARASGTIVQEEQLTSAKRIVDEQFHMANLDHPAMQIIYQLALERLGQQIAEGKIP